jgi:hypothetical protein
VALRDGLVELREEPQPEVGDARGHEAAVRPLAPALDHPHLLHPVEQTGHVRHLGQHPVADLVPAEAVLPRPAQDAQDVVLRGGQPERLDRLRHGVRQERGRALDGQVGLLLQAPEGALLADLLA